MIYIITVSIITVIGLSIWYANRVENNPSHPYNLKNKKEIKISHQEDTPIGFGYKTSWLAIKSNQQEHIATILGLWDIKASNWELGINSTQDKLVFISPTIDDWTLVIGSSLPSGDSDESLKKVKLLLKKLSKEFGEAHFYSTHRVVEFHCWIKSTNGSIERVYSFLGESGENIDVSGEPTEIEKKYNLINSLSQEAQNENYFEREDLTYPDEELVMLIAGAWSINPITLDDRQDVKGLGILGRYK